jgi:hypothetical protein
MVASVVLFCSVIALRVRDVISTGFTIALVGGAVASAMVGYLVQRHEWKKSLEDEIKFRAELEQRQTAERQKQWRGNKTRRLFQGLKLEK